MPHQIMPQKETVVPGDKLWPFSEALIARWERLVMRSCRSLVVRECRIVAESVSTASKQKSQPAAWRTSVVAPNSEVHEILI